MARMRQWLAVLLVLPRQISRGFITVSWATVGLCFNANKTRPVNRLLTKSLLPFYVCLGSEPVETSSRVQVLESGDLLISNVHESDAGQYSCIRANEAGMVMADAVLTVMGKEG